ncbi:MAG: ABC transporter permease [Rhodovulum sulfidophilum]|uniref:ABC transporter permease n=1 Tax=Rhodovulum sulfidophilum TaxID=35806 RepID=A0A2W5N9L4_RHOSU|nr:MAG: ABC transporter permease [Rhodovulum sulfidophilum]
MIAAGKAALRNAPVVLAILPAVAFLTVFLLVPVAQMLGLSLFAADGSPTLSNFARLFESTVYMRVLWNSVLTATMTALFCVVIAYPVAYLLSTARPGTRAALLIWVLLPLWTSFLVRAVAWILILGDQGVLNSGLKAIGLIDEPFRMINTFFGVLVGTVHAMVPIAVMMMLSVMATIDRDLGHASATLGARGAQSFWRVFFPLSLPGVVAAALIVFVNALGFFVASQLLGGVRDMMISQLIIQQIEEVFDLSFAGALGAVLLFTTLLIIALFDRVLGLTSLTGDHSRLEKNRARGKSALGRVGTGLTDLAGDVCAAIGEAADRLFRRRPRGADKARRPILALTVGCVIVFIAAPAFILIPASFSETPFLSWPPRGFTLEWYQGFFTSPAWSAALFRSIVVGFLTAMCAMAIGVPAAYVLGRRSFPGKPLLLTFILIPVVLPSIIIGVGLFYLYSRIGLLQTTAGLVLGHTVFALPYVVITAMAALRTYDDRLDQAASTLGASRLTTFRLISFPLMRMGMASAFLFAFVQSFDELSVALFVASPTMPTLPRQLWAEALYRLSPTLAAASTVMILIVALPIVASQLSGRLRTARERRRNDR